MTWIRWETTSPMHEGISHLAEALNVNPAQAFGHFVACCCGFGEYQQDGRAASVTDTALELWALWIGKRGRFASVFRSLCLETRPGQRDDVGVVKGWWRQRALLDKQVRDAARRKPAESPPDTPDIPPENPRGFHDGSAGDEDGDVFQSISQPSVGNPQVPEGSQAARLVNRMAKTSDRWAVVNLLDRISDTERPAWVGGLNGYLDGLDFPAGMCPTPELMGTACRDYAATSGKPNLLHFRAFIVRLQRQRDRATDGLAGPRRGTAATGQAALEAATRWAQSRGGASA